MWRADQQRTSSVQAPLNWRNSYLAGFLQDDWRLSNRLTVNLGLRWDYELPTSERDDQVNGGFDYNGVALVCPACPASGLPTELQGGLTFADGAIYSSDLNNFGPRAGFTYQLKDQTVVPWRLRSHLPAGGHRPRHGDGFQPHDRRMCRRSTPGARPRTA